MVNKKRSATAPRSCSRRDFMKLAGGGITIIFTVNTAAQAQQRPSQGFSFGGPMGMGGAPQDFNAYLRIEENGRVTVFSGKIEQGQANTTALAQMAAEELDVPLTSIDMVMGDTELCPWDMGTFGSMSIRVFGASLRPAAAEAKAILLEMASEQLKTPIEQLKAENGVIYAVSDKKNQVTYAQLARGQKISRKLEKKPAIKSPAEFKVIGKSPTRVDAQAKVTGEAKFAGDIRFPDMLYAKIVRPEVYRSVLKRADTSEAEKIPGVVVVKEPDMAAVLHTDPEIAEKACAAVKAEWDEPQSDLDEITIFDHIVRKAPKPQAAERKGDLAEGEIASAEIFEQTYLDGYGAHASIETHTACARLDGEKMTVWISTQTPFPNQQEIARALKIAPQSVHVITPYVGGGFGGKSSTPQAVEAARLAKITGRPVQVAYNRREEFFYDVYRAASGVKFKSGVDKSGKLCLWDYHVYWAGSRGAEQFYDVPNNLISTHGNYMMDMSNTHPFAIGNWRGPGANVNVFAKESQMDIMAAKLKMDPLEFRLKNLTDPRMRRVLETVAQRFGYKPAAGPSGRGYGIACGIDAGTYIAEIAEIVLEKGNVKVKRICAAQDMGICVNPDGARMQMEGCIMMGLGYSLSEDISFKGGRLFTTNFHNYKIPRFSWLPEIDPFIVKNDELAPQGGGEPAIVPVGAAIGNAIFDLTGIRLLQMPFTAERIRKAKA